jgi:uncharacterized delta-60 repeat protein
MKFRKRSHQGVSGTFRRPAKRSGMEVPRLLSSPAVLVAATLLGLVFSAAAQAAPGDLDPTFSGDGKQTTNLGVGFSPATAIARQPDGKLVAVGTSFGHDLGDFAVARYNPDGSLDTSFSDDGKLTTSVTSGTDNATGVAVQADGKIVVVGLAGGNFALARYGPDGSLDASFSGDGKQTTHFASGEKATGVALQSDGKIVVVGSALNDDRDFALARFNPDGSLDASFSGDGKQTTDFGGLDLATGVALQSDGKIVVVGSSLNDDRDFALARYNTNGSLDTSFSEDGKLTTDFFGTGDGATGVALQGDGKIVAVGRTRFDAFAIARYDPDGSLDTSFSGDGKQTTDFAGTGSWATGVALEADGKIVAVGSTLNHDRDFAVARYNANGALDPSFSGDGRQTSDFGGSDRANGVVVQADGRIVAVGRGGALDFALARYDSTGSLDTSFSGDGKQTTEFGGADGANAIALQTDGKIVAVGNAERSGKRDFALARYDTSGELDPSFSGDGRQTTDFGGNESAFAVALQSDGKIVVLGGLGPSNGFALARYNPDGSLDPSFSGDGKQTIGFGGFDRATGVAIQADGKIIVVGSGGFDSSGYSNFALARFNPNGELDTTFSGDGKQTTDFFGRADFANGVVVQGDGKIVAVGVTGGPDITNFALARYDADGSLDTSFSGDGRQTTDFAGSPDGANGVAIQGDGKIVAVGSSGDISAAGSTDFALARYDTSGSLDAGFSGDGKQTTDFAGGPDGANGVAIQGDGKIVAVGGLRFSASDITGDLALARYDTDGSLDTGFSGDGRQTTDFGTYDTANGVAIQGDGRIVAAGFGTGPSQSSDFALARYIGG